VRPAYHWTVMLGMGSPFYLSRVMSSGKFEVKA